MSLRRLLGQLRSQPSTGMSPTRALALMTETNATVVDVRSDAEWVNGHIPRAKHIPLQEIHGRTRELSQSRPVLVLCSVGNRSPRIATMLKEHGFDAYHIDGGMSLWTSMRCPVTTLENNTTGGIIPLNAGCLATPADAPVLAHTTTDHHGGTHHPSHQSASLPTLRAVRRAETV